MSNDETKIALLEQSMKQNTKDHKELKDCMTGIEEKLEKFIDSAPNKFASKRTEQFFYAIVGALVIYVGYRIIDLI